METRVVERYHEGRSQVWFWKQVLWSIAVGNVRGIQEKKWQLPFESTEFNPKGLIVSVVAIGLIFYALEHPAGIVAVFMMDFLFVGLWRLIPDGWLTRREHRTQ